ncbi:MAG TPA: hypothetical protein VGI40_16670 [Pirellulaceae bacterium]|jgi:hypothetical protein
MFRFSIRDVLWLTALAAMAVAWWVDHCRLESLAHRLKTDSQMSLAVDGVD